MRNTNRNEMQHVEKAINGRNMSRLVFPIVLIAFFALVCFILNSFVVSPSGEAVLPKKISYVSADSVEDLRVPISKMTEISQFDKIKSSGDFTRIRFTIEESEAKRKLYIKSPFCQYNLNINGEDVVEGIRASGMLANRSRELISIAPTADTVQVDAIFKNSFAPVYKIFVLPEKYSSFALFTDIISFYVFPAFLIFFVLITLLRFKKSRSGFAAIDGAAFFMCLGAAANVYSQYFGDYQKTFAKFGLLFLGIGGIILINVVLKHNMVSDQFRQGLVGIGVVISAVVFAGTSSEFVINMIKIAGIYYVFCLLAIVVIQWRGRGNHMKMELYDTYYTLFCISFMPQWLFFVININIEYVYLQVFFPIVGVICAYIGFVSDLKSKNTSDKRNRDRLLMFKPTDIGRFNDLVGIFLQQPEHLAHARNVSLYVNEICTKMDMPQEESEMIAQAAFLHDIGKMMLPKSLLFKNGKLTNSEYEQIKTHTKYGAELFSGSSNEMLKIAGIIASQHHERYDGNGYLGLKGDEINMYAQIVNIADVFDAATATRSYKKSWTFDEGFDYIKMHSGTLFNPQYAEAFINSRNEIYAIFCDTRS